MTNKNTSWHGGKGSRQRKVDAKKFSDNWNKIFKKEKVKKPESEEKTNG